MATTTETVEQVSLRLLVDKEKNQVVLAETGKEFVDVLLSFLTLPLGTIARLVAKDSNMKPVRIGCLSSLYESLRNMDEKHFWTKACKDMLVQPRNSMEDCCQSMKLNIDDTEPTKFFICENTDSSHWSHNGGRLSTFRNLRCIKCGRILNKEMDSKRYNSNNTIVYNGIVPEMETYIIFDGLKVMHQSSSTLLKIIGCEILTVTVSQKEVLDILKCSLLSKEPLTDTSLNKNRLQEESKLCTLLSSDVGQLAAIEIAKVNVKIMLIKSSRKILFALGEANFVDFILSFLTFPLGAVEHLLKGNSCLGSIDNLYKAMAD